jgi:hypothetical protein
MRRLHLAIGIESALYGAALPYGYTVTVWSSGQLLVHYRGSPHVGWIGLFALGATAGFGLLKALARTAHEGPPISLGTDPHLVRGGAIQVLSIGVAIGAVDLAAHIRSWVVWPLGGLLATALYLLGTSVELALLARERA